MGLLNWVATKYGYKTLGGIPMRRRNMIPFFVYGTLMNGFGNYSYLLKGRTTKEIPATTKGMMFSAGGFPAVMKDSNNTVHGQIMWVPEKIYRQVLTDLDHLEGYNSLNKENSMYLRERVKAVTEGGEEIECWGYIWNMGMQWLHGRVHSGSWKEYVEAEERARIEQALNMKKKTRKRVKGGARYGKVSTR